jgi:putative membrane protein
MILSAAFAFLHFVAVFGIFGTVFVEWLTLSSTPTYAEARRIQLCDRWYGICSAAVLVVGFIRVYNFEKGKAFYDSSPFYRAKLTLFVLLGLLSIYPTVRFVKWRPETRQGLAPVVPPETYKKLVLILRAEIAALLGMALCATLMARGVGV